MPKLRTSYWCQLRNFETSNFALPTNNNNNNVMEDNHNNVMEDQRRKRTREHQLDDELLGVVFQNAMIVMVEAGSTSTKYDHRIWHRGKKTQYDHARALLCIKDDYLAIVPRFDFKEFESMFRIERPRFQKILEDVGNSGDHFFCSNVDAANIEGPCLEARLLLPLKTMAYGVAPHCFRDYFQMSKTQARACFINFHRIIRKLYQKEYLRKPSPLDLKNIITLHKAVHQVEGMVGSLDCMHTYWKNCPVGWQQSFKGKEKRPSIVLEAASDYHLWLWHAAYGYAGALNDLNILGLSPLMESIRDGSFAENESLVVPFTIDGEEFHSTYFLTDGIYPAYSRFVKAIQEPIGGKEKAYTEWQEAVRKDIERAFGVLQAKWQCMARPIYFHKLDLISSMVTCALILHNMCVSDRVMGDVNARYNPSFQLIDSADVDNIVPLHKLEPKYRRFQRQLKDYEAARIHIGNRDGEVAALVGNPKRWKNMVNREEHARLNEALMNLKWQQYQEMSNDNI
jgi:Plant transposon protein